MGLIDIVVALSVWLLILSVAFALHSVLGIIIVIGIVGSLL